MFGKPGIVECQGYIPIGDGKVTDGAGVWNEEAGVQRSGGGITKRGPHAAGAPSKDDVDPR